LDSTCGIGGQNHITVICAATSLSTFETNLPDRRGDALTLRGFVEVLPRLKYKRTAVEMKLCGLGDPIPGACGIPTEPHPHLGPMTGS
jgi:hypothetical protein